MRVIGFTHRVEANCFLKPQFAPRLLANWGLDKLYLDLAIISPNNLPMSRLSFKTFCIELFADYKSIPSNEVYSLFEKKGILKMLDDDYDILHGHGFDYVIHDIEEIMENGGL